MSDATTGWLTTEEAQAQERKTVTLQVANVSNKSARGKDAEDHVRFKIATTPPSTPRRTRRKA